MTAYELRRKSLEAHAEGLRLEAEACRLEGNSEGAETYERCRKSNLETAAAWGRLAEEARK